MSGPGATQEMRAFEARSDAQHRAAVLALIEGPNGQAAFEARLSALEVRVDRLCSDLAMLFSERTPEGL